MYYKSHELLKLSGSNYSKSTQTFYPPFYEVHSATEHFHRFEVIQKQTITLKSSLQYLLIWLFYLSVYTANNLINEKETVILLVCRCQTFLDNLFFSQNNQFDFNSRTNELYLLLFSISFYPVHKIAVL